MADRVQHAERGEPGGIRGLVGLIDEHRSAFEYDWRARFHLPLSVIGRDMSWGEALRLATVLANDPSSQLGAALAKWAYPLSREGLIAADHYDLAHKAAAGRKRTIPYRRPWDRTRSRFGKASRSQTMIRAALRARAPGGDRGR